MIGWNFLAMLYQLGKGGEGYISRAIFFFGFALLTFIYGEIKLEQLKKDKRH